MVSGAKPVFSPDDAALGVVDGLYSRGMAQQMVWLSGLLAYGYCVEVFARIGHCRLGVSSLWRQVQQSGERWLEAPQPEPAQVSPERLVLADPGSDHEQVKGVSLDGGLVNLRGEGWKEIKVGAIDEVALPLQHDERTDEYIQMPPAQDLAYTAVLGDVAQFGPALWSLPVAQNRPTARQSSVTAAGAEWIWNLADDYVPDPAQIVDWYPATPHLSQAAQARFPESPAHAQAWFQHPQQALFLGNIQASTTPLDKARLSDQRHYFHSHQRRMQYQEFREKGFPIGSASVESTVKQFKARLSGPGMRCNRDPAQRILLIRAAVLDHSFDHRWQAAAYLQLA